jgi:hypothetical protein
MSAKKSDIACFVEVPARQLQDHLRCVFELGPLISRSSSGRMMACLYLEFALTKCSVRPLNIFGYGSSITSEVRIAGNIGPLD